MENSWPEVKRRYSDIKGDPQWARDLVALIEHISSSQLGGALHPWTSMFDLCISQTPPSYPPEFPHLRISPTKDGRLEFRYIDTAVNDKQWRRTVSSDEAIQRFESFVEQLHWVSK